MGPKCRNAERQVNLNVINQLDISGMCKLLLPRTAEYTFYSCSHEKVTKIDHFWVHKTHLNKFKIIEIIRCLLLGHSGGIKLETNSRKIVVKSSNTWKLKNTLLNNTRVREEISRKVK